MKRRWIIRSFFIGLLLLCVGGWLESYWRLAAFQLNRPAWREVAIYRGRLYLAGSGNDTYNFPFFKLETIVGTPWAYDLPDHEWIVCRVRGQWMNGYWFVGVPLWLFTGVLAAFTLWVWRKTRLPLKGRAFPVESAKP